MDVDLACATTHRGRARRALRRTLVAESGQLATLRHDLLDDLSGALSFELPADRQVRVYRLELVASFTPYGNSGRLEAGFEETFGDPGSADSAVGVSAGSTDFPGGALATWPGRGGCGFEGVPVPFDLEGAPFTPQQAIDSLNALGPIQLGGDLDSSATLSFSHDGESVCADLASDFGVPASGALSIGGTLQLATTDGALNASFAVTLRAMPADDETLGGLSLLFADDEPCGQWDNQLDFAASCGDFGVDLSGHDGAHLEMEIAVDLSGRTPSVEGVLQVMGETRPDCLDNPPEPEMHEDGSVSVAGCEGIGTTAVATIEIGGPSP